MLPSATNMHQALSFLTVLMLFIHLHAYDCSYETEMNNLRWFVTSFVFMVVLSYTVAMFIYRLALLAGV